MNRVSDGRPSGPRVGIGLVVRNGGSYFAETVADLLAQTYDDFHLVIGDNASTDDTEEVARSFAASDERISYIRHPEDLGPAGNYDAVERLAGGELFKWSAADDRYDPRFLEACVDGLDANPDAVLAYPHTRVIGPAGEFLSDYDYEADLSSPRPSIRLRNYMAVDQQRHMGFEIFGVIRRTALDKIGPKGAYARADHVLCAGLALLGTFLLLPEPLFLNRDHPKRSVRSTPSRTYNGNGLVVARLGSGPIPADDWWDPTKRGRVVWPEWRLFKEYLAVVDRAGLPPAEDRACRRAIAEVAVRHVPKLGRDVLINTEFATRKLAARRHRTPASAPPTDG
jgi:glycosyltransferase involved in cell wall biosynthesis